MTEKRKSERKAARLKVRFWRAGQPDRVYSGYTSNISLGGCFVQTDQPVGTGGRLQLELSSDDVGFVCEALVARSIKAPYELRQVKPSGMGVRFLSIEELLCAVVPGGLEVSNSANQALKNQELTDETQLAPHPTEQAKEPATRERINDFEAKSSTTKRVARRHPAAPPLQPAEKEQPTPSAKPDQPKPDHAFRIAPPTLERLAALYHAELLKDRLFIPTNKASRIGATVRVELVLPETNGVVASKSVELRGVVQKQWSKGDRTPDIEGFGIKLHDTTSAKKTIGALIAQA